jgi:hypothetical protein
MAKLPVRWLTLAEIVGVAALVIAGLGYWDNHRERIQSDRERASAARERAADARANAIRQSFVLTGTPSDDGARLRLTSIHDDQTIQTQEIWFPAAVRGDSVRTTGNPRIEAGWIARSVAKADGKAMSGRVPVGVLTVFIEDGKTKTDRAVYYIGYSRQGRLLRGDRVTLEGLSVAQRGVQGDLQKAADALWAAR